MNKFKVPGRITLILTTIFVFLLTLGVCAAANKSYKTIPLVIEAVKSNFIEDIKTTDLINGGGSELKKYLTSHKKNSSYIKELPDTLPQDMQIKALEEYIEVAQKENADLPPEDLENSAINGIVDSLGDQFSIYLTPKEYKNLVEQMEGGNFGGLGISIELDESNNNALTVIRPLENTPAFYAGIQTGDVITHIAGKPTSGLDIETARDMLRGKIGTKVTITIFRKKENKSFTLTLTRALIHIKSVNYKIIDGNLGYIRMYIFGEETSSELEEALNYFDSNNVRGYILDLRNNGGGYIDTAITVCSKFMPTNSLITSVKGRNMPELKYRSFPNPRALFPTVVLINQYSASASEIAAAALKTANAPLVGEKTYGKASVQKVIPLPFGAALKLTTAYYCTPDGKNINKIGIEPDVLVKMALTENKTDIQLSKAVEILKNKIQQSASI